MCKGNNQEGGWGEGQKKIFETQMTENFHKLMSDMNEQINIQLPQERTSRINAKENKAWHIISSRKVLTKVK